MIFHKQEIEGVFVIEPEPFKDDRGAFRRNYCLREFMDKIGESAQVMQANISENRHRYTLRGFHYQEAPNREAKTLTVVRGAISDTFIDLRPESKTYMQWRSYPFNAGGRLSLHIPMGVANAFLTLEDNTVVHYYVSEFYSPEKERGIRYNDPTIFHTPKGEYVSPWPCEYDGKEITENMFIISDKDRNWHNFLEQK